MVNLTQTKERKEEVVTIKCRLLLLITALILFFTLLHFTDNKYKTPPPYGRDGVISLTEDDISNDRPLMLVSGWLLSDTRVKDLPTYIGKYSNLQRDNGAVSPHGSAVYKLTLRYSGTPIETAVSFPQLFSRHTILFDGQVLSDGNGGAKISFTLTPGDHLLMVRTASERGYYSGMYHPPMLGETEAVLRSVLIQCVAYGFAFFGTLTLALFTLTLWRRAGDKTAYWFGLLCCAFSFYLSYYFVRLLNLPLGDYWYLVQSMALYLLCFCVIRLTALTGEIDGGKTALWIQRILIAFSLVLLAAALFIPVFPQAVRVHGMLTDLYYIFTFCALLLLVLRCKLRLGWEYNFTLLGCTVFGAGLLINLLSSNLFEPILFFWQFEWCGLFLVVLFGVMMAARNRRMLAENEAFSNHLEELVEQRTKELTHLLQERKSFFADMAHDLKAPIFATKGFIQMIRKNDTGIDSELQRYLDQVEQKQQEMSLRVQSLTVFNNMEDISEPWNPVSIRELLQEAYEDHHMSAEVMSVHLVVIPPKLDGSVLAQPKKLTILLENLIFNALRATPGGGSITLSAELHGELCLLTLADTGTGIAPEALPHIFQRFFVGAENKGSGSGLGLYIVKSIVEALHGKITVSSTQGQGTVFYIELPLIMD